jgi:hypothetical protein
MEQSFHKGSHVLLTKISSVVVAMTVAAGGVALDATTYAPTDFAELVNGASTIVHARVVAARADWVDGRMRVDTFVTLEVERYFKGDLGSEVVIQVPGGELGRYRDVVIGAPRLTPGDEVILFLNQRGARFPYVLGLSMGVFRVRHDASLALVSPAPASADPNGGARRIARGSASQAPVSMATFAAEITRAMSRSGDRAIQASPRRPGASR